MPLRFTVLKLFPWLPMLPLPVVLRRVIPDVPDADKGLSEVIVTVPLPEVGFIGLWISIVLEAVGCVLVNINSELLFPKIYSPFLAPIILLSLASAINFLSAAISISPKFPMFTLVVLVFSVAINLP